MVLVAPELEDAVSCHKSELSIVLENEKFYSFVDFVAVVAEVVDLQLVELEMAAFANFLLNTSLLIVLDVSLSLDSIVTIA
jgi:hypothetical protein